MTSNATIQIQNKLNEKNESVSGKIFTINRLAAMQSGVIRVMAQCCELDEIKVIPLHVAIPDHTLGLIVEWLDHHKPATDSELAEDTQSSDSYKRVEMTEWDQKFFDDKVTGAGSNDEGLLRIIFAANYLGIENLLDMGVQVVANMLKGKSAEEIRYILKIQNDFTPEEEEAIRAENNWTE
ncbi:E3 ubiquitin ligase [Podospora australis]|uniref:E3 ubiquitin ligase complex SCF subunit n=1 Tax=Podospora australis TaxID=1536484 RepID=A0AAN6WSY2_9PEZI|nr:E3 ubiquitin ligase [Podospora australis]